MLVIGRDVLSNFKERVPILGICLGFQGIVIEYGGNVTKAPEPFHGRLSKITVVDSKSLLFKDIPSSIEVVRYHSFIGCFPSGIPEDLLITSSVQASNDELATKTSCWPPSDFSILMSIEHKSLPLFGVQFHPESIGTKYGNIIARNFLDVASAHRQSFFVINTQLQYHDNNFLVNSTKYFPTNRQRQIESMKFFQPHSKTSKTSFLGPSITVTRRVQLNVHSHICSLKNTRTEQENSEQSTIPLDRFFSQLYEKFYSNSKIGIWLDSNDIQSQNKTMASDPGFRKNSTSIIADFSGVLCEILESWDIAQTTLLSCFNTLKTLDKAIESVDINISDQTNHYKHRTLINADIFSVLQNRLLGFRYIFAETPTDVSSSAIPFKGGYIGYFGYETKYDAIKHLLTDHNKLEHPPNKRSSTNLDECTYPSQHSNTRSTINQRVYDLIGAPSRLLNDSSIPLAWWCFIDRFIVYDSKLNQISVHYLNPELTSDNEFFVDDCFQDCDAACNHGSLLEQILQQTITTKTIHQIASMNKSWARNLCRDIERYWRTMLTPQKKRLAPVAGFSTDLPLDEASTSATLSPTQEHVKDIYCEENQLGDAHKYVEPCGTPKMPHPNRPKSQYLNEIEGALKCIQNGENYQLCLTNHLESTVEPQDEHSFSVDCFSFYMKLRNKNPAPYSAFIKPDLAYNEHLRRCFSGIEGHQKHHHVSNFSILCSSPESFLQIRRVANSKDLNNALDHEKYWVSSSPIKGTCKRDINDPQNDEMLRMQLSRSEKDRAENLIILDLLRNDLVEHSLLGRVCIPGSVGVPEYMNVHSYASVHHIVSTVVGCLDYPTFDAIDCITASFPGGSMTGAPKLRALKNLHRLEGKIPRGIYSGSIGYLSIDGSIHLNIVIRTVTLSPHKICIGSGGGIISLSNPVEEYNEMLLKASTVSHCVH